MSTDSIERAGAAVDWTLRVAILGVVATGVRQHNPGAVANGLVAFVATFLPRALRCALGFRFGPRHRVWLSGSMLLHATGMLGPYDDVWWWDHVTHTLSASLVGAAAHLLARRRDRDPTRYVLGATVGAGLFWEALEYVVHTTARRLGLEPLLIQYGHEDTLGDLFFDAVGALLVLAFGDRVLEGVLDADD
ncbi:hypothetical protein [Halarchaeum grantii]|uniref:hypothetical protein n=1 Tax=Halarchaeum grantii TaxID=1193105 RepID=UPI00166CF77E|nr:hypothetical protein [Halarchaeum grantii]